MVSILLKAVPTYFKNLIRDYFYAEVVSERIVEYPKVISEITKNLKPGAKILDIGCYYSNLPIQLASMGYKVTGLDLQRYTLTHPNFKFLQGDVRSIKFQNKYDAVSLVSTLEHIGLGYYGEYKEDSGDRATMRALYKLLKKKGLVFLTVPFGLKSQNDSYKTYDWETLIRVLKGFKVKKAMFYISINGKWTPADRKKVSLVHNATRVGAIAFVMAQK